jgi:hypothetical protein
MSSLRPRQALFSRREVRFLGLIVLTLVLIALSLGEALRQATPTGRGHRVIDRKILERRIEAGDLSDREAAWYHPATADETRGARP